MLEQQVGNATLARERRSGADWQSALTGASRQFADRDEAAFATYAMLAMHIVNDDKPGHCHARSRWLSASGGPVAAFISTLQ